MKAFKNLVFVLVITSFVIFGCEKEKVIDNQNQPVLTTDLSGFGDRPGTPAGTPFFLPDNVELTTDITLYYQDNSTPVYGIGEIELFFTLNNYNNKTSTVIFPAGLIFLSDNDSSQSVMTVHPVQIELPSESSEKIKLRGFCVNKEKYVGNANYFTISIVSSNNQVKTLTNNLENKSDSLLLYHTEQLQNIVWNITDGDGLTQADLNSINSW